MGLMYERKYGGLKKPKANHAPPKVFRPPRQPQKKLFRYQTPKYRAPNIKVCPECGKIFDLQEDPESLAKHMNIEHPDYIWVNGRYQKQR